MQVLFCLVAWMDNYQGEVNDKPVGGGTYIAEHGFGSEIYNFSACNKPIEMCHLDLTDEEANLNYIPVCHGFVMIQGGDQAQMHIERLGAKKHEEYVTGVLVVWLAKHPTEGGIRVVGWYKNATVFRWFMDRQEGTPGYEDRCWYNVEARASDCVLLETYERTHRIPRAKQDEGGIGRSNIWYAEGEKNQAIVKQVIQYIKEFDGDCKPVLNNMTTINREELIPIEINSRKELQGIGEGKFVAVKEKGYRNETWFKTVSVSNVEVVLLDMNMQVGYHVIVDFELDDKKVVIIHEDNRELGELRGFYDKK